MKGFLYFFLFFNIAVATVSCTSQAEKTNELNHRKRLTSAGDFHFRKLAPAEEHYYAQATKDYYDSHLGKTGFNGAILLAKNGQIVFEDYRGVADFKKLTPVTSNTPFHLASISKTFTGMEVLKLWEQGRLSLNDSLQQYFPQFPYHGINIRMLLDHRSGLPNYLYFMDSVWDKKKKATNEDVLNFMIAHQPKADAPPNRVYHYCNTNFVLLALIIEKVTHQPFPQFMKDSVFTPLGMNNTFVFSIQDTLSYVPTYAGSRPYPMDHLDCTYGDKNVYSTVRDLLQWDKALYQHTFVTKTALDSAFLPRSNERKSMHNYGLGWHLYFNNGDTLVYHNGKWHGSNTVFTRFMQDTATIIVLGNKLNRAIYQSKDMGVIFTGHKDTAELE
ncbi:beta-lactamase family protein [Ilyomonas limi]|uniref:Beta-lactamase family protein n=1 Tax=Ilyomonas limi TaxID=2575867 RepID=A0A4U3L725_9BACT|nr:serine hydrolase domain-containing protein [Ilyomonas limi]TKK70850.1 beta-lactamase family protein [Ilyomonas limi]